MGAPDRPPLGGGQWDFEAHQKDGGGVEDRVGKGVDVGGARAGCSRLGRCRSGLTGLVDEDQGNPAGRARDDLGMGQINAFAAVVLHDLLAEVVVAEGSQEGDLGPGPPGRNGPGSLPFLPARDKTRPPNRVCPGSGKLGSRMFMSVVLAPRTTTLAIDQTPANGPRPRIPGPLVLIQNRPPTQPARPE